MKEYALQSGDAVPPNQTSGKAHAAGIGAGVGAALGGLLTRLAVGLVESATGEQLSADDIANVGILCAALGAIVCAWAGAFLKRNFLT